MRICVTGAGGFIASHLACRLKQQGHYVVACDWRHNKYMNVYDFCDEFHLVDLRMLGNCKKVTFGCQQVYHLAADMGGMGHIQNNHASILYNNTMMSFNMLEASRENGVQRYFFASSACVYPEHLQASTDAFSVETGLKECDAWPAAPQDAYGLEKLVTEELCKHYQNTYSMQVRIGRYHNVYGPKGTWKDGKEKAPAAICRKVAAARILLSPKFYTMNNDNTEKPTIDMWGDGEQTRSFMYIDDCVEGTICLMQSSHSEPLNIGSSEIVSINELLEKTIHIAGKSDPRFSIDSVYVNKITGPEGVRGRNSDNTKIKEILGWEPTISLDYGMSQLFEWIQTQVDDSSYDTLTSYLKCMQYVEMT